MIQFAVDDLVSHGVREMVINFHHLPEASRAGLGTLDHPGAKIHLSDESRQLLGSAGGMIQALPHLGTDPFFYVNSSDLRTIPWDGLVAKHRELREKHRVLVTLAILKSGLPDEANVEIEVDPASHLIVGKKPPAVGRPFFSGVAVVEPEVFRGLPKTGPSEFVPEILLPAVASGKAGAFLFDGLFLDGGMVESWWRAHFKLMAVLEAGSCPPVWRKRIETVSRRLASGVWALRESPDSSAANRPGFWGSADPVPSNFGPNAVFYGDPSRHSGTWADGIGLDDLWAGFA
jgi:MurNAc alpha-1-phosphate uridylyltransferase